MFDNLFFEETFTEAVNSFLSQVGVSFFFDCDFGVKEPSIT